MESFDIIGWIIFLMILSIWIDNIVKRIVDDIREYRDYRCEENIDGIQVPTALYFARIRIRYVNSNYSSKLLINRLEIEDADEVANNLSSSQIRQLINFLPKLRIYLSSEDVDKYIDLLTVAMFKKLVLKY